MIYLVKDTPRNTAHRGPCMFTRLVEKIKHFAVTFRFSILSIFIVLFSAGLLSLIGFTYHRMSANITDVSSRLIKQISAFVYHEIVDVQLRSAELTSQSLAQLIKQNVLNLDNEESFLEYSYNILQSQSLPIVQIIEWGDKNGNYYGQEREPNGRILTNIIHRTGKEVKQTIIYRDATGKIIKTIHTTTQYDPRIRPWYIDASQAKHFTWTQLFIFKHISSEFLGMAAVTPVYDHSGTLKGVVGVGIRIDYLASVIQDIHVSQHGSIYIITHNGKLIATSHEEHKNFVTLTDIHDLGFPAITNAYEYYLSTKNENFILTEKDDSYIAKFFFLPNYTSEKWMIGIVAPESDFIGTLRKDNFIISVIGFIILGLGILIVMRLVNWIVRPLNKIASNTEKIKNFNLEDTPPIRSRIKEVMHIANAISSMKKGLLSFQKYVPASLVRQLIETGEDARIGGSKKHLAILFTDVKDFTTLAESKNPNELIQLVCEYLDALSSIIVSHKGTIDKYIGDSIMAFWGAPLDEEFPCEQAARTALACKLRSNELNTLWTAKGKPALFTRFGIHFGEAIVGNIGSKERLNYTALGDSINMASRLESINKLYGSQIIVSENVYHIIKRQFILRMLDYVYLKGKTEPTYLYELIAENDSPPPYDLEKYSDLFHSAFHAYQQKNWQTAVELFNACLFIYPNDTIAPLFISRCQFLMKNPPDATWNGAWLLVEK